MLDSLPMMKPVTAMDKTRTVLFTASFNSMYIPAPIIATTRSKIQSLQLMIDDDVVLVVMGFFILY